MADIPPPDPSRASAANATVTAQLDSYKNLAPRWHRWENLRQQCQELALTMTLGGGR